MHRETETAPRLRSKINIADRLLEFRKKLRRLRQPAWFSMLRRTVPLSSEWGFERGKPIDRYYIEQFLAENQQDIRGRVLEVRDNGYTLRYGNNVLQSDILDINPLNPLATIVADLSAADRIASNQFDCLIVTQTMQFIYDIHGVVAHAHRILRPGGVLLVTVPCVSRIAPRGGLENDYWRFTTASCSRLFGQFFEADRLTIRGYGNVLTCMGFLNGMASEEVNTRQLAIHDPYFQLLIGIRAIK